MEAPERIWINLTTDLPRLNGHIDKNSIKYARADTFINKACDWIEDNIYNYLKMNRTWNEPDYEPKLIEDFRKAMKGE